MSITSTSCKVIVTDASKGPVKEYFALVHWHEDSKQFDFSLTDGQNAWIASGCSITHPLHVTNEEAWNRCKIALSDTATAASPPEYIAWTTEQTSKGDGSPDQLQLIWGWGSGFQGREVMRVVPWLEKQTDSAAAIRDIMRHMLTSHSLMKTAVVECQQAQQQLERSLAEKEALLKQTAEARQEQERVLFTKFAMLLNKKTERIVQLTETLQQQAHKLERLQGSDEHDTDDEAREAAAIYEAETEDDEPDEEQQHHADPAAGLVQQQAGGAAGVGQVPQRRQSVDEEMQDAVAGELAAAAGGGGVLDDQATQPLDADVRAMLDLQHKRQLQQHRQPEGGEKHSQHAGHDRAGAGPAAAGAVDSPAVAGTVGDDSRAPGEGAAPAGSVVAAPAAVAPAQPRAGGVKRRIAR